MPESATERVDLLFVEDSAVPEVWVICGDRDDSAPSKKVYVYVNLLLPILVLIMAHLKALRRNRKARALRRRLLTWGGNFGSLKAAIQALRYLYKMV